MFVGTKQKKLVEVLLKMGKISPQDTRTWQELSNEQAEKEMISKGVNSEDIAKAYAEIFELPFVNLKDSQISHEALETIPENLAREYKIIAYELNFPHKILKVAVSEPGKLTANLKEVIHNLEKEKDLKIELAITAPADFNVLINQYSKNLSEKANPPQTPPPALSNKTQLQTIDLSTLQIPLEVISKFPEDIARKYNMVVFEAPHPSFIKVATSNPDDKKAKEILDFVREKNDIAIQEFIAPLAAIRQAFRFYEPQKEIVPATKDLSPRRFEPKPQPLAELAPPKPFDSAPSTSLGTSQGKPEPPLPKKEEEKKEAQNQDPLGLLENK